MVIKMMTDETFLKQLKSTFDLNIYEAKIWVALLSKGAATAGELAEISSVPRSRSYDILESLEKKGFIIMKFGKPIKYLAVQPDEVLYRLKKEVVSNQEKQMGILEKVKNTETFNELELLYKNGINHVDPTELSGMIKGRKNIYSHLDSLLRNSKKSVIISTTSEGLNRKIKQFKELFEKLDQKDIKIRITAPIKNKELIKELKGVQLKNNLLDSRFIVIDSSDILIMLSEGDVHEKADSALWIKSPYFAKSLEDMFNITWKK